MSTLQGTSPTIPSAGAIQPAKASDAAVSHELKDPFTLICVLLTHDELANKVSLVCKQWKEWADSAPVWTPSALSQLNVRVISRYFIEEELKRALPREQFAQLSFEMIPYETDIRMALIKASRFIARIKAAGTAVEGDEGIYIVPRPEGLTLNMLHTAYRTRFRYIWDCILTKLGDKRSEGGPFMITSNILENTRGKTVEFQQDLSQKAGGNLPEVLNALFYALMVERVTEGIGSFARSINNPFDTEQAFSGGQCSYAIRPLNDDPWTYTRCLERIGWPLVVGGFAPAGLGVDSDYYGFDCYGAGALRKF